jgi:hypothetical protein
MLESESAGGSSDVEEIAIQQLLELWTNQLAELQRIVALKQISSIRDKRQLFSQILGAGRGKRQLFSQILGGGARGKRQLFSQILGAGRGKRQLFSQILGGGSRGKRQLFSQILGKKRVSQGKRQLFSQILSRRQERDVGGFAAGETGSLNGDRRDKRSPVTWESQPTPSRLFSQILRKKLAMDVNADERDPVGPAE